jgi:protein-tyrosine phosphatase
LLRDQVRHVVDVRDDALDDEEELRAVGIQLMHLPIHDGMGTGLDVLRRGVDWIIGRMEGGERVLVHCEQGMGRSVLLALCVLTTLGFAPLDALSRVKQARPCVSPSPAQLEAFIRWCGPLPGRTPAWHELASIAYSVRRSVTGEFLRV